MAVSIKREQLARYEQEVLRFAKVLNLTSLQQAEALRERLIHPSLAMAELLPDEGRLLDVGSGMGIPGVPILLAKPALHGILVERRIKRAEFLRHIKRTLDLDVEVYAADLRQLPPLNVNACVARAVDKAQRLLAMCGRHMQNGGVAALVVPRQSEPVEVPGWRYIGECFIGGGLQLVHRYHYQGVSRET